MVRIEDRIPIAQVLIVDDEVAQVTALCRTLQPAGYATRGVLTASAALEALREGGYDVLLTDLVMPGTNGIELARAAQRMDPDLVSVVMTGHGSVDTAVAALKSGVLDYILKPFNLNAIMPVLSRAVMVRRLRWKNSALLQRVAERTIELDHANEMLLGAQQRLQALTESISRELVTPLGEIVGCCEGLIEGKAGPITPNQREYLADIRKAGRIGAQLIDSLGRAASMGLERPLESP